MAAIFCHFLPFSAFLTWPPLPSIFCHCLLGCLEYHGAKSAKTFSAFVCQFGFFLPYIHYMIKNKVKTTSPLHVLQSVMTECQCMHIGIQDPSLVIRTSHECLGLFLRTDIESLAVDAFEAAIDHCIFLLLCLKDTLVQFDVLHTHSLTVNHNVARNSLCCVVYHMLLINQAVHLRSQSHELRDAMSVVLILEDGSRQFLVEVEERLQ